MLTQHLLENYDAAGRAGRPVVNMSDVTSVSFGLGLIQMDLDEKEKVLETSMWAKMVSAWWMLLVGVVGGCCWWVFRIMSVKMVNSEIVRAKNAWS